MLQKAQGHQRRLALPYDGIIRTGSKGVSHFAEPGKDPHASGASYWKVAAKASLSGNT
jgi:hypothetical protein